MKNIKQHRVLKDSVMTFQLSPSTRSQTFMKRLALCITCMTPSLCFAASDAVVGVINNLCEWLSGPIAVAISVLVVIFSGFELMQGHIEKRIFAMRALGLGLVVGGTYIARSVLLNGVM